MGRPSKQPPVVSSLVPAIARHAAAAGVDVAGLALRFGLPVDVARLGELIVPADVPDELMHAVDRAAGLPDVALRLGAELTAPRHSLVHLVVQACGSVREGLVWLARGVGLLHEGLEAAMEEGAGEVRWVLRSPRRPRGVGRYVHELALAHVLHEVRAGAAGVDASRVWFLHARGAELGPVRTYFGTDDVAFGCEDSGLALSAHSAARAMGRADPRTLETLAPLVEAELVRRPRGASVAERVRASVTTSLPDGADIAGVARAMHMSARTVQRRLEQEGTRFTEVLDGARRDQATRLLADPALSLTEIAFRVGFADLATFSRAFRRWTGAPPGQWRRS